jgi:hypothetical protein
MAKSKKVEPVKLFADGDVSEQWRVAFPETLGVDGWAQRSDLWPFGITVKPGVDPAQVKLEVCAALAYPEAFLLDGSKVEAITWEPHEVRLVDRGT